MMLSSLSLLIDIEISLWKLKLDLAIFTVIPIRARNVQLAMITQGVIAEIPQCALCIRL